MCRLRVRRLRMRRLRVCRLRARKRRCVRIRWHVVEMTFLDVVGRIQVAIFVVVGVDAVEAFIVIVVMIVVVVVDVVVVVVVFGIDLSPLAPKMRRRLEVV